MAIARREIHLLPEQAPGLVDVAAGIPAGDIHVDVAGEQPILVADHRRSADRLYDREFGKGDLLLPSGGPHQHPLQAPRSERKSRI